MGGRARRRQVLRYVSLGAAASVAVVALVVSRIHLDDGVPPRPATGTNQTGQPSDPQQLDQTLYVENLRNPSVTVIDLENETKRSFALPEMALGDDLTRLVRIGNRLVFRGAAQGQLGAVAVDLEVSEPPKLIGRGWYFVPSDKHNRLWIGVLDPDSPETERALKSVYEVTTDGTVTTPSVALPKRRWTSLLGATSQGLVFQLDGRLEVWDPATQKIVRTFEGPFPVGIHASAIAWCEQGCPTVTMADVTEGTDTVISPPPGYSFEESCHGEFSPDGQTLATPVKSEDHRAVTIIDVETGTSSIIDGSDVDRDYGWITWSSAGDTVFFNAGDDRVMYWTVGSDAAGYLPYSFDQEIFSLASS